MQENIRKHVEGLFAGTAPSKKAVELKEEMIQNLTEKYNDLLGEGKTPEAAYNIAIAGIGDVSYLLKDLDKDAAHPEIIASVRQKSAMLTAFAIMLYIVSVIPVIILGALSHTRTGPIIGVVLMFIFIALGTGLLIYNGMTKPKYLKANDSMVEDFKQWQAGSQEHSGQPCSCAAGRGRCGQLAERPGGRRQGVESVEQRREGARRHCHRPLPGEGRSWHVQTALPYPWRMVRQHSPCSHSVRRT